MTTMTRSTHVARPRHRVSLAAMFAVLWALAPAASAQDDTMTVIDAPDQPNAIALDTGTLPDAKQQEAWHRQYGSVFARNVTDATLTPRSEERRVGREGRARRAGSPERSDEA